MSLRTLQSYKFQFTIFLGLLSVFLVFSIIVFPERAFEASLHSLTVWWTIVFPALLPFLIIAEIMLAYGLMHFWGVLLEPLMRLLFRLPGVSGPVIAIGFTIGYPIGAKFTQRLRHNNDLSKSEGELLLSLSHVASPLLMINVIAVGFFNNAQLGIILIVIQLLSLFVMGLILRLFLARKFTNDEHVNANDESLLRKSITAMRLAHREDGRTFGKLLGDAVGSAIQTLMMIGGYMMIFAVVIQVIISAQFTDLLYALLGQVMSENMLISLLKGLFEIHLGSFSIVDTSLSWQMKLAVIGALLAWSGFSLHAQVKSLIHQTDLRYRVFLIARLLQAGLAFMFTLWLWTPLSHFLSKAKPSFLYLNHMYSDVTSGDFTIGTMWGSSISFIVMLLLGMTMLSLLVSFITKTINFRND